MNFVLVNPIGGIGGAERILLAVLGSLRERFPEARITLATLSQGDLLDEAHALGAEAISVDLSNDLNSLGESTLRGPGLSRLLLRAPRLFMAALRLRRVIESRQPNLVHSFGLKTHLLLGLASPRNARILWHLQDFYSTRAMSRILAPRAAKRINHALAISNAVAEDSRRLMPDLPITVAENAIETRRFTPHGPIADLDALAGVAPAAAGTLRVGLVATYARWKGHHAFLEAVRQVSLTILNTPARFYIVGSSIYATGGQFTRDELESYTNKLGLTGRVLFVPFQPDPSSVYRALDVIVHASTEPEPFGLVIAEGMACGRAVIVSAAGGAADLFEDGVDGLGHQPGNVEALASAILRLTKDPVLRERLGTEARKTAERRFGMERYADEIEIAYRSLLPPPTGVSSG